MIDHVLGPGIASRPSALTNAHREWLKGWLDGVGEEIERGEVAASVCVAGLVAEDWLYQKARTDWRALMKDLLEAGGNPLSYSERFGRKLFKFNCWQQTTVHAVYSRWWVERALGGSYPLAGELVESFVQPSGLVYNPEVSPTGTRTRMKSELLMSLAMASEILVQCDKRGKLAQLKACLVSLPATRYISAEYFRFRALENLGGRELMVGDVASTLRRCRTEPGFADYCVDDKVNDYMGSAHRVERDRAVFSPISSLQGLYLAERSGLVDDGEISGWRSDVNRHLTRNPLDIPALRMRDLEPEFGEGATAYEVLAAAHLMS